MIVFPESTKISLCYLLYLLLVEGSAVESALGEFFAESIAVLPLEDKEVALLIGAVARIVQVVVSAQARNRLALGALILLKSLLNACRICQRVSSEFVQSAQLLSAAVQQIRLRLDIILLTQGLAYLLFIFAQVSPHNGPLSFIILNKTPPPFIKPHAITSPHPCIYFSR